MAAIENRRIPLHGVLGVAHHALGPHLDDGARSSELAEAHRVVDDLLSELGWSVSKRAPSRRALVEVVKVLRGLGREVTPRDLFPYAEAASRLAEREIDTLDLACFASRSTAKPLLEARNDVRTTLLQALGGAFLLVGLYFTYRTIQVNREAQITERFTRAIDQLGNKESLDVRLGGIYALERIAQDSRADHGPVMEVLTAFLS